MCVRDARRSSVMLEVQPPSTGVCFGEQGSRYYRKDDTLEICKSITVIFVIVKQIAGVHNLQWLLHY